MKLSKAIILSGILFSSVLGSINVNSITALAAGAESSASTNDIRENITIKYMLGKNEMPANLGLKISFENVKISKDNKVSLNDLKDLSKNIPSEYVLKKGVTTWDVDSRGNITIELETKETVENNKEITVSFIDDKGNILLNSTKKVIVKKNDNTLSLDKLGENNIPAGYTIKPNQQMDISDKNMIQIHVTKNVHASKPARYVIQRVRITYVNKETKEQVGYLQLIGKDSFSKKITAPEGYAFLNEKDATVKFDKKGNKDINVYVKQMTAAPVKHEGTVTTSNGQYKLLFNLDGKAVKNRALSANSSWYTDQYAVINGEKMYRVATNEWVKASDIL